MSDKSNTKNSLEDERDQEACNSETKQSLISVTHKLKTEALRRFKLEEGNSDVEPNETWVDFKEQSKSKNFDVDIKLDELKSMSNDRQTFKSMSR